MPTIDAIGLTLDLTYEDTEELARALADALDPPGPPMTFRTPDGTGVQLAAVRGEKFGGIVTFDMDGDETGWQIYSERIPDLIDWLLDHTEYGTWAPV